MCEVSSHSKSAVFRVRDLTNEARLEIVMGAPVTFVTGKGGVGKTTLATLLSREALSHGERVLFISLYRDSQTDELLGITENDAKNDVFRSRSTGFDVSVITPSSALINYLASKHMGSITARLNKTGLLDMVANLVPGMRELLVIGDIRAKAQSGKWDRVIIDSPSTGHARSLFNVSENTNAVANNGVIKKQSEAAREFLRDPKTSQVVIATLDHAMPLSECREFIFDVEDDLHMKIAAVIVNKSRAAKTRHSIGIDKNFKDIFVPIFSYPTEGKKEKRQGVFTRFLHHKKLPEQLHNKFLIPNDIESCVVLGTGGVGKTTTASAIALSCALKGKKVALLTIDPARRLGTALGLDDVTSQESFLDAKTMDVVDSDKSNFDVFQLDSMKEFLRLLEETLSETAFKDAKDNTFVSAVSKMGIVNEFMAIEAMHRLVTSNKYEVVVVDTPPSHHVYDLLEAPKAMERMTQSSIYKTLVGAGTMASLTTNMALNTIFRPLRGLVGAELVSDAVEFIRNLKDVEEVFTQHSSAVVEHLSRDETKYVVVCNPTEPSQDQALSLIKGMFEREFRQCDVIVNGIDIENPDDVETTALFASRLGRFNAKVAVIAEQELDDPFEIVRAIAENVDYKQ